MTADLLSRQAIRLAVRKSRKAGRPLTEQEIRRLRIQTVEPWKRAVAIGTGLLWAGFAYLCYHGGAPVWFWIPSGMLAGAAVMAGAIGSRSYLDRELRKLQADGPIMVLDAIINALI
jgi:hypothetical protein